MGSGPALFSARCAGVTLYGVDAERFDFADQGAQGAFVVEPLLVLGDLLFAQYLAHRLVVDLAGPEPVGPVELRGFGVAATAGFGAVHGALEQGAGDDRPDLGDGRGDAP